MADRGVPLELAYRVSWPSLAAQNFTVDLRVATISLPVLRYEVIANAEAPHARGGAVPLPDQHNRCRALPRIQPSPAIRESAP